MPFLKLRELSKDTIKMQQDKKIQTLTVASQNKDHFIFNGKNPITIDFQSDSASSTGITVAPVASFKILALKSTLRIL